MTSISTICVYCGSSPGSLPEYMAAANSLGQAMTRRGINLVYGGSHLGLMGRVADSVLAEGGKVTGVIPKSMAVKEVAYEALEDLRVVGSMHERKLTMARLSDGFIALPGGLGTFEELFEMMTWSQLGFHQKPIGILNVCGYYDPLLRFLEQATDHGFMRKSHQEMLLAATDPDELLDMMHAYQAPEAPQWLKEGET